MNKYGFVEWLRKGIISLLFLVPFTALLVSGLFFFPFITTKAFFFRTIVEAAFALYVVLIVIDRSYLPWRSRVVWLATAFTIIVALADVFGLNPTRSIWSNFERMEGLVAIVHIWAYLLMLVSVFRTEKIWNYFWHTTVGASVLVGLYGLIQLLKGTASGRLDATLGNAAYLGTFMFFNIFLTGYLWLNSKRTTWHHVGYGLLALLQVFVLYKTATRGAMIGLVVAFMFILIATIIAWIFGKISDKFGKTAAVIFLICVIGGYGLYAARETIKTVSLVRSSPVLSRFADISLTETTTRSRFMIWNMAWQGIKERPILGWGQENFSLVFNKYYDPRMYDQEPWFDRTHNILLDWLVAAGILGLIAYLSFYFWSLWATIRSQKLSIYTRILFVGLISGYLIQNLVIFDNLTSYILFFSFLAFLSFVSEPQVVPADDTKKKIEGISPLIYTMGMLVLVGFGATWYMVNGKPVIASASIISANRYAATDYNQSFEAFTTALNQKTFGDAEIIQQMATMAPQAVNDPTLLPDQKEAWLTLTNEAFTQVVADNPYDARLRLIYGGFLRQFDQLPQAHIALDQALALAPNKQQILISKGALLADEKRYSEALVYMKKAFDLEQNNKEARKLYALVAWYAGNRDLYQELVTPLFVPGTNIVDDNLFINLYASQKDYPKLIAVWTRRVTAEPLVFENRIRLVGSYYASGNRTEAIKVLEQARIDFPTQSSLIESYIEAVKTGQAKIGN